MDREREKKERLSHKIGHDLALYRTLFVAHIQDSNPQHVKFTEFSVYKSTSVKGQPGRTTELALINKLLKIPLPTS